MSVYSNLLFSGSIDQIRKDQIKMSIIYYVLSDSLRNYYFTGDPGGSIEDVYRYCVEHFNQINTEFNGEWILDMATCLFYECNSTGHTLEGPNSANLNFKDYKKHTFLIIDRYGFFRFLEEFKFYNLELVQKYTYVPWDFDNINDRTKRPYSTDQQKLIDLYNEEITKMKNDPPSYIKGLDISLLKLFVAEHDFMINVNTISSSVVFPDFHMNHAYVYMPAQSRPMTAEAQRLVSYYRPFPKALNSSPFKSKEISSKAIIIYPSGAIPPDYEMRIISSDPSRLTDTYFKNLSYPLYVDTMLPSFAQSNFLVEVLNRLTNDEFTTNHDQILKFRNMISNTYLQCPLFVSYKNTRLRNEFEKYLFLLVQYFFVETITPYYDKLKDESQGPTYINLNDITINKNVMETYIDKISETQFFSKSNFTDFNSTNLREVIFNKSLIAEVYTKYGSDICINATFDTEPWHFWNLFKYFEEVVKHGNVKLKSRMMNDQFVENKIREYINEYAKLQVMSYMIDDVSEDQPVVPDPRDPHNLCKNDRKVAQTILDQKLKSEINYKVSTDQNTEIADDIGWYYSTKLHGSMNGQPKQKVKEKIRELINIKIGSFKRHRFYENDLIQFKFYDFICYQELSSYIKQFTDRQVADGLTEITNMYNSLTAST